MSVGTCVCVHLTHREAQRGRESFGGQGGWNDVALQYGFYQTLSPAQTTLSLKLQTVAVSLALPTSAMCRAMATETNSPTHPPTFFILPSSAGPCLACFHLELCDRTVNSPPLTFHCFSIFTYWRLNVTVCWKRSLMKRGTGKSKLNVRADHYLIKKTNMFFNGKRELFSGVIHT